MIRPLRRLHPWLVAVVAAGAGAVALVGLRDRSEAPTGALPAPLSSPAIERTSDAWQVLLDGETTIRVRRDGGDLLVWTEGVLEVPEPRLLWIAGDDGAADDVSLGGLRGRGVERLPAPAGPGRLLLSSLGHGEVLAEVRLDAGGDS